MFRCGSPGSSRPWRGFPIRTPWDHSPVIDSPRLIADSYVLLRLLMPRHPPCALKNLTTKDQFRNFREHHRNHPHPKVQTDPGSYSWKLLLIKDARVHYVVLKQQPRTTHPTHQPPQQEPNAHDRCSQETRNKQTRQTTPQPKRLRPRPDGPVASGPNSVPNTTQQPIPAAFQDPPPKRMHPYSPPACATRHLFVDIPPLSTRRRTSVCATGIYS